MTYIYEGIEVKATGREAVRTKAGSDRIVDQMIEITPVREIDKNWDSRWVRPTELYRIITKKDT